MALSARPAWATEFQDYIGPFSKGGEDTVEMERDDSTWDQLGAATQWLPTICNPTSRGSSALFWPLKALSTHISHADSTQ